MRIAIVNWTRRKVGGAEQYLSMLVPELNRLGHHLAVLHEVDEPSDRPSISLPTTVPVWCASTMGSEPALAALREWRPDLIYAHGLLNPELEALVLEVAPAIFFAHNYYGTCISGAKTFRSPVTKPCSRRYGRECLLLYYPRRCGGWNPLTMYKGYRLQAARLKLLARYTAILTHTRHMEMEFRKHGLPCKLIAFCIAAADPGATHFPPPRNLACIKSPVRRWNLLFTGRMDHLKGGSILLDALPLVADALDRPLHATFAGDGPQRHVWQAKAERMRTTCQRVSVEFTGWLDQVQLRRLYAESDLLVLPSLWPEPFGMAALEAGCFGVPVVAFAVGGIPDWLTDGVNGYLAPGDPPRASGLAEAILKCLQDPQCCAGLRRGALERTRQFSIRNHLNALLAVFEQALHCEATR